MKYSVGDSPELPSVFQRDLDTEKESIYLEQTGVYVPLRVEKPRRYAGMEN